MDTYNHALMALPLQPLSTSPLRRLQRIAHDGDETTRQSKLKKRGALVSLEKRKRVNVGAACPKDLGVRTEMHVRSSPNLEDG